MRFKLIPQGENLKRLKKLFAGLFLLLTIVTLLCRSFAEASVIHSEPVNACVIARSAELTPVARANIARCLGWQDDATSPICHGFYLPLIIQSPVNGDELHILADDVSMYNQGRSKISGNVEIKQTNRVVNAETAYIYRDSSTNKVTKIELLGEVRYLEAERLMIAGKVTLNPTDKSGKAEDVLYRFNSDRAGAALPSWGQASLIERFGNKDYLLRLASYTTCAPQDNAWHLEAKTITLDNAKSTGVARDAKLYIGKYPVFYAPYFSFPTTKERKSGFLLPTIGSSNVGGFDVALPYYWNIAPNYDATITPHLYTLRGLMLGGEFRYLTGKSLGSFNASFLSEDRAFKKFINDNLFQYPQLEGTSFDRWSLQWNDITHITPNLQFRVNYQQVSDDYYLQDFSSNLALLTERQLIREADLAYTSNHWYMHGMLQSYQTLQPINQTPVSDIYQRLPQLLAMGNYDDLPFGTNLTIHGQFDNFNWPNNLRQMPEGPRFYLNPVLSMPIIKPWGYVTPAFEVVQNYYDVHNDVIQSQYEPSLFNLNGFNNGGRGQTHFERTIPRYSVDSGLFFERGTLLGNEFYTQTLEPRLYYLNVPYQNQTPIPVYDTAYLIFNYDQLFRNNRFSGFDRIGDTNQLAYALTSRWIADNSGAERASFSIGQIQYFSDRKVKLCQDPDGNCIDNPLVLGYLSPYTATSPIASRAVYHFNPFWIASADYVYDVNTKSTNNGHLDFHYQPSFNKLIGFGYTYMTTGDITQVAYTAPDVDPLHQASFSYAWPYNDHWGSLGAFSYNISKQYQMMSMFGIQYDNCCWALRLIGGRSFMSLSPQARPQYNNNVFLQVQLKGLGSLGNSDPSRLIKTFIPGFVDTFHR